MSNWVYQSDFHVQLTCFIEYIIFICLIWTNKSRLYLYYGVCQNLKALHLPSWLDPITNLTIWLFILIFSFRWVFFIILFDSVCSLHAPWVPLSLIRATYTFEAELGRAYSCLMEHSISSHPMNFTSCTLEIVHRTTTIDPHSHQVGLLPYLYP